MNIEIANRLVTLRKQFNLSQEDLAERLGISRQAVSRWERAEASPDTDNLINLSKLYGVSIDSLLALEADGEEELAYHTHLAEQPRVNRPAPAGEACTAPADHYGGGPEDIRKILRTLAPVYPILVTIVYLLTGFFFGLWHPGWILYLTIPVFYVLIR